MNIYSHLYSKTSSSDESFGSLSDESTRAEAGGGAWGPPRSSSEESGRQGPGLGFLARAFTWGVLAGARLAAAGVAFCLFASAFPGTVCGSFGGDPASSASSFSSSLSTDWASWRFARRDASAAAWALAAAARRTRSCVHASAQAPGHPKCSFTPRTSAGQLRVSGKQGL